MGITINSKEDALKVIPSDTELTDGYLINMIDYIHWKVGEKDITLDATFSVEQLKAIVWLMENSNEK